MESPRRHPLLGKRLAVDWAKRQLRLPEFDVVSHSLAHEPKVFLWTSKKTLTTVSGVKLPPLRPGLIVNARASVQTAPSGNLTWDILKNGVSIFQTKPTILSGETVSEETPWIDNGEIVKDDTLQVQITTVNGAGGPMVVELHVAPLEAF